MEIFQQCMSFNAHNINLCTIYNGDMHELSLGFLKCDDVKNKMKQKKNFPHPSKTVQSAKKAFNI